MTLRKSFVAMPRLVPAALQNIDFGTWRGSGLTSALVEKLSAVRIKEGVSTAISAQNNALSAVLQYVQWHIYTLWREQKRLHILIGLKRPLPMYVTAVISRTHAFQLKIIVENNWAAFKKLIKPKNKLPWHQHWCGLSQNTKSLPVDYPSILNGAKSVASVLNRLRFCKEAMDSGNQP